MGQSGPQGYDPSWTPEQAYGAYQGLTPDQQQGYVTQYNALPGAQQQGWLDATGQSDPTGGVNNPNYVAPPPPPKSGNYPSTPVPTNMWTPDPVDPPGTPPTPPAPATMEAGAPWDDLTSPRFQAWFNAELTAGRSPGLNWNSTDPTSPYGTAVSTMEQNALKAEFDALPPEVQAAYVERYMTLTPMEQQMWRNAFGTDNEAPGGMAGAAESDLDPPNAKGSFGWDREEQWDPSWQIGPDGKPFIWGGGTGPARWADGTLFTGGPYVPPPPRPPRPPPKDPRIGSLWWE